MNLPWQEVAVSIFVAEFRLKAEQNQRIKEILR
jgi:hypothetical protein